MTVQDLITGALRVLEVIDAGVTPNSEESADGLAALNLLLSSWSTEKLSVNTIVHGTFAFTANVSSYTMGPLGTWVTAARPVAVSAIAATSGNFRKGLARVTPDEFLQLANPTGVTAVLPENFTSDNALPVVNVRVFPPPSTTAVVAEVDYWTPITAFAALADNIDTLAPGVAHALKFNLAAAIAPEYGRLSAEIIALAQASKGAIIALNANLLERPAPSAQ